MTSNMEYYESIRSRLLSYGTLMSQNDRSVQRRFKSNTPSTVFGKEMTHYRTPKGNKYEMGGKIYISILSLAITLLDNYTVYKWRPLGGLCYSHPSDETLNRGPNSKIPGCPSKKNRGVTPASWPNFPIGL